MVEGKSGGLGPPVHCFLEQTEGINGFSGDGEDARVNCVARRFKFMFGQCACIGLASANCSPMAKLETLIDSSATFTIVAFATCRAHRTINGALS